MVPVVESDRGTAKRIACAASKATRCGSESGAPFKMPRERGTMASSDSCNMHGNQTYSRVSKPTIDFGNFHHPALRQVLAQKREDSEAFGARQQPCSSLNVTLQTVSKVTCN